MTRTVLFAGPSLAGRRPALPSGTLRFPPAAMGDVWRVVREGVETIGLVDGVFGREPAVWHKEILYALSRGVRVVGAGSMGALRAAELHVFGMEGVGWIFEAFRDGLLEDDDEVALAHGPGAAGFRPLSEPMVNIRRTLDRAVAVGELDPAVAGEAVAALKASFYPLRTREAVLGPIVTRLGLREGRRVAEWLDRNWIDQKQADALLLIDRLATPGPPPPPFELSRTAPWVRLVAELETPDHRRMREEDQMTGATQRRRREPAPAKPWSLLVFISADNNLAANVRADIDEMCSVGATGNVAVACDIDMPVGVHAGRLVLPQGPCLKPPGPGGELDPGHPLANLELKEMDGRDDGDPVNLSAFLNWANHRSRSKEAMLVVWGHGQGMRVAIDTGDGDALTMPELSGALVASGVPRRRKVGIIAFDACLMSALENLFQFWKAVPIMIASQEVMPETGFPYADVIRALDEAETATPELAARIVDRVALDFAHHGRPGTTIAALSTDGAEAAVRALDIFGRRLAALLPAAADAVGIERMFVRTFRDGDYVDLVELARALPPAIGDAGLATAGAALEAAVLAAVIRSRAVGSIDAGGNVTEAQNVHGLSIWFPAQRGRYRACRADYRALNCFSGTEHGWIMFLDAYHRFDESP
jgi:hypothetical protein